MVFPTFLKKFIIYYEAVNPQTSILSYHIWLMDLLSAWIRNYIYDQKYSIFQRIINEEGIGLVNKSFVVFLDVDGVLNSRSTVQRTPDGYQGIDDARVEILSKVIQKMGGGEIVLSSDWKNMKCTDDDYVNLVDKLGKFGLSIVAHTEDQKFNRGAGILTYLEEHPDIMEYVILDDCKFDFQDYRKLWERLLITDGIERAKFAAKTPAVETMLFLDYIKES